MNYRLFILGITLTTSLWCPPTQKNNPKRIQYQPALRQKAKPYDRPAEPPRPASRLFVPILDDPTPPPEESDNVRLDALLKEPTTQTLQKQLKRPIILGLYNKELPNTFNQQQHKRFYCLGYLIRCLLNIALYELECITAITQAALFVQQRITAFNEIVVAEGCKPFTAQEVITAIRTQEELIKKERLLTFNTCVAIIKAQAEFFISL